MNKSLSTFMRAGAVTGTLMLLAACAGNAPRPVSEIARASALIEQAERNGAQQFAASDLMRAREHMRVAESAVQRDRMEQARRAALEAAVDAELAASKTQQAKAERAAAELDASVRTLKEEARRGAEWRERRSEESGEDGYDYDDNDNYPRSPQ